MALDDGIDPANHTHIDKTDHGTFKANAREWLTVPEPTRALKYAPQATMSTDSDATSSARRLRWRAWTAPARFGRS